MVRRLALACLLAGCASSRWVVVSVRTTGGAPLADTIVAAVCRPLGSAARLTGAEGTAVLEVRNARTDECVVTATREGYATRQTEVRARCKRREACAPVELALEAE